MGLASSVVGMAVASHRVEAVAESDHHCSPSEATLGCVLRLAETALLSSGFAGLALEAVGVEQRVLAGMSAPSSKTAR